MVTSTATQLICYLSAAPACGWLGSGNGLSAETNQIELTICCDAMRRIVFLFTLFLKIAYFHGYVSWILSASFWGHNKTCILESVPVPVHPWLFGSWQLLNFTWKWDVSAFHSVEFYSVQLNNLSVVITAFSPWNWSVGNLTKTSSRCIKKKNIIESGYISTCTCWLIFILFIIFFLLENFPLIFDLLCIKKTLSQFKLMEFKEFIKHWGW